MSDAGLARVQAWLQASIVAHARPRDAAAAELEPADVHVRPSGTQSAAERVAIYGEAYLARLTGVLAEDFVAVRALVGCAGFEGLVRGYLIDHPSRSFTLSLLGRHLPDWLAARGDDHSSSLADVARVELAMARAFDAPRETALTPAAFAAEGVDPDPTLRIVAAHEILDLAHAANDAVTAARAGEHVEPPLRRTTRILVWRKDHVVWRRELSPAAFALLRAIERGAALSRAIDEAWSASGRELDGLEDRIPRWLAEWSEDGLFAATR
jgi:hypothetical protein